MIVIDGSAGEGGGQILRTSLTLSMWTGQPFRIERIRAGRKKPGLLRQHLTAVQAAAEVSRAEVEGAQLGSASLTFRPGAPRGGEYLFRIGSAGSTTLVLQTVFYALLRADQESRIVVEGGTHNPTAPPFDFLQRAWLPALARMGVEASLTLDRHGFYPAGGGRLVATLKPVRSWRPLELVERGTIREIRPRALVSALPDSIAARELDVLCAELGLPRERFQPERVPSPQGPGNAAILEIESEALTELLTSFGERGTSAESVAEKLVSEARQYLQGDAPVGEHLADQLLLPMALGAGGVFRTFPLSGHTRTHAELLPRFLPVNVRTEVVSEHTVQLAVEIS